ncbi:hypothetical protein DW121_03135 [Bacteroides sp. AM10-21B]|nr:hypothetical protein DW121_03135 [Bacteroides sp. AM10-21B]
MKRPLGYKFFLVFQLRARRLPTAGCRAHSWQPSSPQLENEEKIQAKEAYLLWIATFGMKETDVYQ